MRLWIHHADPCPGGAGMNLQSRGAAWDGPAVPSRGHLGSGNQAANTLGKSGLKLQLHCKHTARRSSPATSLRPSPGPTALDAPGAASRTWRGQNAAAEHTAHALHQAPPGTHKRGGARPRHAAGRAALAGTWRLGRSRETTARPRDAASWRGGSW